MLFLLEKQMKNHIYYMNKAIFQAKKAYKFQEVPVGAIVVDANGAIIGRGYNRVEAGKSQLEHAECRALRQATRKKNNWRLEGCWLYVTLEPCTMCMAFATLSRVQGVVYGADSPQFGFQLDKECKVPLYKRNAVEIVKHIAQDEAAGILKKFFKKRREQHG
jgi:tRNA(adenine34) deaminase